MLIQILDHVAFGVTAAAEERAVAPLPFEHGAAAFRALVFGLFAYGGATTRVHGLGLFAIGVAAARQEKAILADTVQHRLAAFVAHVFAARAPRMLELFEREFDILVERTVEIS